MVQIILGRTHADARVSNPVRSERDMEDTGHVRRLAELLPSVPGYPPQKGHRRKIKLTSDGKTGLTTHISSAFLVTGTFDKFGKGDIFPADTRFQYSCEFFS